MTTEINTFLSKLSDDWQPIKEQALKYFDVDSKIREDGAAQIFRRPWVAPQNFGLLLFPTLEPSWISLFHEKTNITIPIAWQKILLNMNGCFVYSFSLYGLPKSIYTTGLLDRSRLHQYDLGTANTFWIHSYDVDKKLFHIGGRKYSYSENIGYFTDGNLIFSIRKNGEILTTWTAFADFLKEEISTAEQIMLDEKAGIK